MDWLRNALTMDNANESSLLILNLASERADELSKQFS